MSGTEDKNFDELNSPNMDDDTQSLPGANNNLNEKEELSASQKMDLLIRASSSKSMKKEIERLRKEAARYRTSSREESAIRLQIQAKADEIQNELNALKASHNSLTLIRKLDKAGCIKSELVVKDIPSDCEDVDSFITDYKKENPFLFSSKKQNIGGMFKPSKNLNLTSSQKIDKIIRSALGR